LHPGNGAETAYRPGVNLRGAIVKTARKRGPQHAPYADDEQDHCGRAGTQNEPGNERIGEVEKPFGGDRPGRRRAAADGIDQPTAVDHLVNPALYRQKEIRQRLKNRVDLLGMSGPIRDVPLAHQHIDKHHQQKERIEPGEARPQEGGDAAQPAVGHQAGVVIVDDKAAEHEEQRHAEAGRPREPERGALRRLIVGDGRSHAVRQ